MAERDGRKLNWGNWNAERPVEIVHPTLGVALTPLLYSSSTDAVSLLPPATTTLFGERALDGNEARLRTAFAGTTLDWRLTFHDDSVEIDWRTHTRGEWGLRFWVLLCVHERQKVPWHYNADSGTLHGNVAGRTLCLQAAEAPLLVTFHNDIDALCKELVDFGYFYLGSRGDTGHCAALRFNLEEAPLQRIVCRLDSESAVTPTLPDEEWTLTAPVIGVPQQALQAISDVMRWNHVFDYVNQRPYTALTRFWSAKKFGGFGVWLDDVAFNAWLWGHLDTEVAKDNLAAIFAWQTEAGNFPCLVTGNDAWLDRSQIPILGYVVWNLYQRSGDRDLLSWAFPKLLANFDWWWQWREPNGSGLVAYGTTQSVGQGLYRGTKLAAKNESAMDNSPVHDDAPFDRETGLLQSFDVGLNSLLALDNEMLIVMAETLDKANIASRLRARHKTHLTRIREYLWDDERGVFANRLLNGDFIRQLAPTSFYPLVAGAATREQAQSLIDNYLSPSNKFGGDIMLPSVARDDPAYQDHTYWRGRVWPPLNFWVQRGLSRAGFDAQAVHLAEKSWQLFHAGWEKRLCGENFNAETGAIADQPDTDTFYSWGALMPAMVLANSVDVTPWHGLSIDSNRLEGSLGPLQTALGPLFIEPLPEGGHRLKRAGQLLWETTLRGRIYHIAWEKNHLSMVLPSSREAAWLHLRGRDILHAKLGETSLTVGVDGALRLPARDTDMQLSIIVGLL